MAVSKKSLALVAAGALLLLTPPLASAASTPNPSGADATVAIGPGSSPVGTMPDDFMGFSYESSHLSTGEFDTQGNYPQLLRNLGTGVLRFGGNTVDESFAGATPAGLDGLKRLTAASGWHVLYSENGGHFDAGNTTKDAAAVSTALGPALAAIACGNEPNAWAGRGYRPAGWNIGTDAERCLSAIRQGAPQVPFAGPDTFGTSQMANYTAWAKGKIAMLTQHYYAIGACKAKDGTADVLLSRQHAASAANQVAGFVSAAKSVGVPLRLSEMNSADCGGIPGVSDSYASSLWATDFLLSAAEQGVAGVNLHGGLSASYCSGNTYSPICTMTGGHQYEAKPVYYGMLFAHLLGTGKLLDAKVTGGGNLAAHAVLSSDGTTRALVENLNGTATTVSVHLGTDSASVITMTGPSLDAKDGIKIQGAQVASDGTFKPGSPDRVSCNGGDCQVTLAPYAAEILSTGAGTVPTTTTPPTATTPATASAGAGSGATTPVPSTSASSTAGHTPAQTGTPAPSSQPHGMLAMTGSGTIQLLVIAAGVLMVAGGGVGLLGYRRRRS